MLRKTIQLSGMICLAVVALLGMRVPAIAGDAAETAAILQQIQANALDIQQHAARIKSNLRVPESIHWKTHSFELSRIQERTNDIAELLGKFKQMESSALPRQKKAFNRIVTEAAPLSNAVEKAINYLDQNRGKVWGSEYEEWANDIYDRADQITQTVNLAETLAEVKELANKS